MTEPRFRLHDLSIDEGSLVDSGDNPEAHIKLFKLKDTACMTKPDVDPNASSSKPSSAPAARPSKRDAEPRKDSHEYPQGMVRTTAEILAEREFHSAFCDLRWAYQDSVGSILAMVEPAKMGALLTRTTDEFTAVVGELIASVGKMAPAAKQAVTDALEKLKAACAVEPAEARGEITRAVAALDGLAPKKTTEDHVSQKSSTTAPAAKTVDEILAALPEADRAAVKESLDAAAKATADAEAVKVEATKQATAKADAEKADLAKRVSDAEATIAKMKDEKLTAEFTAKAREIGAGDVADVAMLLKSAHARDPKEGEVLERILRAQAAQVRKGALLTVVGSDAGGGADSPEARLEVEAKKIAEAEKCSYHVAYGKALDRNAELARAAIRKQKAVGDEG